MKGSTVFDCLQLELPKNHSINGNITEVNNGMGIPFSVNRLYFLHDIPGGESRGGHAHMELQQLVVALCGSFDITLNDGNTKRTFHLSRPNMRLFLPSGLWRGLNNFSSGSICMVLASDVYSEKNYFRNYEEFKVWKS